MKEICWTGKTKKPDATQNEKASGFNIYMN